MLTLTRGRLNACKGIRFGALTQVLSLPVEGRVQKVQIGRVEHAGTVTRLSACNDAVATTWIPRATYGCVFYVPFCMGVWHYMAFVVSFAGL